MAEAFIIMQIGNADLDEVCERAIVPALKNCGLEPKRVDKHNKGGLLKSEIIGFIDSADIIVADLTNERPNCYLEVGYAMGKGKFGSLILTAREDHYAESPSHVMGGPRVHFDLSGYDILFWHPDRLVEFQNQLAQRIMRRLSHDKRQSEAVDFWPQNSEQARVNVREINPNGFIETFYSCRSSHFQLSNKELLDLANKTDMSRRIAWPVGTVYHNKAESRPRSHANGIAAEISMSGRDYYYWTLKPNGDFYQLSTLFEDIREEHPSGEVLNFDTQISIVASLLLYCGRLYSNMGFAPQDMIDVGLRYCGLKGRFLSANGRFPFWIPKKTFEDEFENHTTAQLVDISAKATLPEQVRCLIEPLFMLFDFTEFPAEIYSKIIEEEFR